MENISMEKTFFGFALADSMFCGDVDIRRRELTADEAKRLIAGIGVESCLNPSHEATIKAMTERFGIVVAIPEKPPQVALKTGDSLIVMGVRGLPRLTDRHEYTHAEIESAIFTFAMYIVMSVHGDDLLP